MPRQNRVTPSGDLVATPARGLLMGNRGGRFHDPQTATLRRRRWASRQWISCVLNFRERHREVWNTGYTELFFLDEVTALAAGHRPCFECRRSEAAAFAAALSAGIGAERRLAAPEIDRLLHGERVEGRGKRRHVAEIATLPDAAMVEIGGRPFAVRGDALLPWTAEGYGTAVPRPPAGPVTLLTPPTIVAALSAGYRPLWHPGAG